MIRNYDLSMEAEILESMLNNPENRITRLEITCMVKSGYTTATLHFDISKNPIVRKRYRKVERYILFAGQSSDLDEILTNPEKKIMNKHEFVTEQGVIIVVDYEFLKERS